MKAKKAIVIVLMLILSFNSTMGIKNILQVYADEDDKGNVHGTVLDENGDPLDDVKITIYSTSGNIDTAITNGSGYFRLALKDGRYTIEFTKEGYSTVTKEITVPQELWEDPEHDPVKMRNIVLESALQMNTKYLVVSAELGESIELPLTIMNGGEKDEIIAMQSVIPDKWSIKFFTPKELAVKKLNLDSKESEELTIQIEPAEDASIGDYDVIINAFTEDNRLNASLKLEVNLREASYEVEIISTFKDITAKAGESFNFPITIWNRGGRDALMLLTVTSAPENWETVFVSDDTEISNFLVEEGQSIDLQLEVTPPSTVDTGDYQIVFNAESDDGLIQENTDLTASIVGSYDMRLELSTLYKTLTIGDSMEFTARVTNQGSTPITSIYLEGAVPEDWEMTTTPAQTPTLASRESVTFTITAETPADTVAGDYLITLQAMSDQAESEEVDLRVTAQASTSWGFIGVGIAGVVIIGLVLVFWRFKRR